MCGIAGFSSFKADYTKDIHRQTEKLVRMRKSIAHRGNDQNGEFLAENVGLAHTRLSIRDIKNGIQPMTRGDFSIVYNGEIYNTDEIKKELKEFKLETTSDTEVILCSYIKYGIDCVKMLNGIFAFAIWDASKKRLILFRDRSGIKPLYYTINNDTLVFASEMKAIFEYGIKPECDIDSFREIFAVSPAKTDGVGVFKNISEVKQASVVIFDKTGAREHKYWSLESHEHNENYKQSVERVRYLVQDAIERQMVSDVDVCAFLSGGIDSSIVTAAAYNYLKKQGRILNTFSFDFSENDIYFKSNSFQPERDKPFVDMMLETYPTNHTYLECDNQNLYDYLFKAVDAKDLPGMADVESSLLYFCQRVKEHNKVALTGECADEIFGGYPWFHNKKVFDSDNFPWTLSLEPRKTLLRDDAADRLNIEEYSHFRYNESIAEVPVFDGESSIEKRRREISYLNLKWFMQTLLRRMDNASMYYGLEARVPFADHRIIEYLWNMPWKFKCPGGVVKGILRDAFSDMLPKRLIERKKSPYPKTYNPKYEKILRKNFTEMINDSNQPVNGIIDKQKAEDFLKKPSDYSMPWFGQLMASPQLMAYMIQVNYWLKKYNIDIDIT